MAATRAGNPGFFASCPHIVRREHFRYARMADGSLRDYCAVHRRLRELFRKPKYCWSCGLRRPIQWALVRSARGYSFDIGNYLPLCRGCHIAYDKGTTLPTWIGCSATESDSEFSEVNLLQS